MRTLLISLVLMFQFILVVPVSAQWPTEPGEGLMVIDTECFGSPVKLALQPDGGIAILFYTDNDMNDEYGFLAIQTVYPDGSLRWEENPAERYITNDTPDLEVAAVNDMVVGEDGTIWIVYQESRFGPHDEFGNIINTNMYVQRINSEGYPTYDEWGVLLSGLYGENHQSKSVAHIEPNIDGSAIVVWRASSVEGLFEGGTFAQTYNEEANGGNGWGYEPVRISTGGSSNGVTDYNGGLFIGSGKYIKHLLTDGTFAWPEDSVVFDSLYFVRKLLRDYAGIIRIGGPTETDRDNGVWLAGFTEAGEKPWCEGIRTPPSVGDSRRWGLFDEPNTVILGGDRIHKVDENLNITSYDLYCPYSGDGRWIADQFGFRQVLSEGVRITGFTTEGEQYWEYSLEGNTIHSMIFIISDQLGNTWIVWQQAGDFDIFMNVIGPDGQWGVPMSDVEESPLKIFLPEKPQLVLYPVPFNSSLSICFNTPYRTDSNIKIYDALGREVAVLLDGLSANGRNTISWQPGSMASGVYYVQLTQHRFGTTTQKVLYLK